MFKDAWMPYLEEKFPIARQNSMPSDLQKLHSVMVPGYCEPQLLYLFQVRVPFEACSFLTVLLLCVERDLFPSDTQETLSMLKCLVCMSLSGMLRGRWYIACLV